VRSRVQISPSRPFLFSVTDFSVAEKTSPLPSEIREFLFFSKERSVEKLFMPHILLTNDDGYQAEGLRVLAAAFEGFATVSIVAPSREQSGTAQSLTLRQPIVCNKIGEREWAIDGTPADCVIVALHKLLPEKPDMVISGINHGANLGENVYYSGTVGAAREGALHHIPSVAMSLCSKKTEAKFENSARVARAAAEQILKEGLPDQVLLNVNVPEPWNGGVKFTRQSQKITRNQLTEGKDPRGRSYFWLYEQRIDKDVEPDTDYAAIFSGAVSITPLHLDPTHTESLNHLSRWTAPIAAAFTR
jgi:5'-nucleotidase